MKARLILTSGPHRSQVIAIRRGQLLRIGRTRWADVSLAGDSRLAPIHFSAEFDGRFLLITDLSNGLGLQTPEGELSCTRLCSGMRFRAGQSEFLVELPTGSIDSSTTPMSASSTNRPPLWQWRDSPWSKSALSLVDAATVPIELLNMLIARGLYPDAWLLVGSRSGPAQLVGWLAGEIFRDLEPQISQDDRSRFSAVQVWAEEASPQRFQAVLQQIPEELETPGAWIAQAVGWTAANLLPEDVGHVPMPPGLYSRACACAVTFLAMGPDPSSPHVCQARMLEQASRQFGLTEAATPRAVSPR